MKAHLAKVSLALLSTVFLFGCQEQGPAGPEGPQFHGTPCEEDHKKDEGCGGGGGGGGGKEAVTLDLEGSMEVGELPVTIGNNLGANNNDFMHDIEMKFLNPGTCVGEMALMAELESTVEAGHFTMQIYDNSSGGFEGLLLIKRDGTFADATSGATTIRMTTNIEGTTITGPLAGPFVWTGPVMVSADGVGRKGSKGYREMRCSGPNTVTATINR